MYDATETRTARAIRMVRDDGLSKAEAARRVGITPSALSLAFRKSGMGGQTEAGKRARLDALRRKTQERNEAFEERNRDWFTEATALLQKGVSVHKVATDLNIPLWRLREKMAEFGMLPPRELAHMAIRHLAHDYFLALGYRPIAGYHDENDVIGYEHYIEGKSYRVLAKERGITRCTVAGVVHRCRNRIERYADVNGARSKKSRAKQSELPTQETA